MKFKNNIFNSIGKSALSILLLGSLCVAVLIQHHGYANKFKKNNNKASTEHNIKASNALDAIIPSLNVEFLGVCFDLLKPYETISQPFLFEIVPANFISSYFTNLLTHFISPRAP